MYIKRCQYCGKETPLNGAGCSHCRGGLLESPGVALLDTFDAVKSALSDKYEIIAEIGQGGNATVYQAIQKNLDRKVALKVLLPDLVDDPGYMERFHLEARAIAKLRHPNIVTIYDEGSEQGVHFMSMEFLEGKDLHHVVKEKGSLGIQEAVDMAKCIARALDYAHSYGIIHRDVKSSNIIMTSTRTSVLTDFGIAQSGITSVYAKSDPLLGTPEFMSPEQAGGKTVDSRTDFYSLGVVLYHTLSGRYPFPGDTPVTIMQKILYEDPVPLGKLVKLPPALERAVEWCLVKDPRKRVQNGKELIELLNSVTVRSSRPSVRTPAPRLVGQVVHRPLLRTVVLAATACLMLTGYVTWHNTLRAHVRTPPAQAAMTVPPVLKPVPNLIGGTKEEATRLLRDEGFEIGSIRVVAVPNPGNRGKIDSQRPLYGDMATPGTTVDLLIGE